MCPLLFFCYPASGTTAGATTGITGSASVKVAQSMPSIAVLPKSLANKVLREKSLALGLAANVGQCPALCCLSVRPPSAASVSINSLPGLKSVTYWSIHALQCLQAHFNPPS